MLTASPPAAAAWSHHGLRTGFETLFIRRRGDGFLLEGCTTAVEDSIPWVIRYEILVDGHWVTRGARIHALSGMGSESVVLDGDGDGHWTVDGHPALSLDGCLDVDLEASAMTNTLPIHRLAFEVGDTRQAAAAYVRAPGLEVQRLEQSYQRVDAPPGTWRFAYEAPVFDFRCELSVDKTGLVVEYPDLATRVL